MHNYPLANYTKRGRQFSFHATHPHITSNYIEKNVESQLRQSRALDTCREVDYVVKRVDQIKSIQIDRKAKNY